VGDSAAGVTTFLVPFEADEISTGLADSLSSVPVCVGLSRVQVLGADGIRQPIGVWCVAFAGLLAVWSPSEGSLGAAWMIVVVVLGMSVGLTIVIVTVAPKERDVVWFFEDSGWQRQRR
jgi:hypothetical protein